jgi:serine phosphatase RsbU (regulator of sigma subunit)
MIVTGLTPVASMVRTRDDRRAIGESFSVWSEPAAGAVAGGDWCDILPLADGTIALTIGDVSGHGLDAAPERATVYAAVRRALDATHVPSDVLAAANAVAYGDGIGMPLIVTAVVAVFDRRRRTLTFANAGHPPPLVCSADAHTFLGQLPADLPLGIFARHHAANYVMALPADVLLVMYTDGITEHVRDPIAGEDELVAAARWAYARPDPDVAASIAERMLARVRGDDDAATIAVRLTRAVPRKSR